MSILDKKGLHPVGGYCTCYSAPYSVCSICCAVKEQERRWKELTPKERKEAMAEYERTYPRTSNQDGR